jgi:hypothetical protein
MAISAEIKGYFSSDVDDLRTWTPASPEDVYIAIEISIGVVGDDAADIFQLLVACPEAIRGRFAGTTSSCPGRAHLLLASYDWAVVAAYCESVVSQCIDETWEKTAERLCRHFLWEYEDYQTGDEEDDERKTGQNDLIDKRGQ